MKAYLAGPMTGIPQFNFPAFFDAADQLRSAGHEIISPAELDDPEIRNAVLAADGTEGSAPGTWDEYLARDIKIVCDPAVEAVVVLDGWRRSKGATFETDVARRLGKPILSYPDLKPVEETGEVRITDPETGGMKGRKPERYELLPFEALNDVARVYAFGAEKYEDWNWAKGFPWSLSIGAAFRHMAAFASGEDTDPESGLPHPAHAVFHMLGLMMFRSHGLGTDDRWRP